CGRVYPERQVCDVACSMFRDCYYIYLFFSSIISFCSLSQEKYDASCGRVYPERQVCDVACSMFRDCYYIYLFSSSLFVPFLKKSMTPQCGRVYPERQVCDV